ncbi:MAG: thiazole synthase [Proteobacteria bacterium]|nr:MAG: thiazole synthase [Pseudomonadota bacterium]
MDELIIAGKKLSSRLFLGTGKFSSVTAMREAVIASGSKLVTVALKRVRLQDAQDQMLSHLRLDGVNLLPNTSGARNGKEAVLAAKLAREALETNWLKLEIHPDQRYLLPDPVETLKAAEELVKEGFVVLPYIHADPVVCKRLEDVGAAAVMPLGSPIGSSRGLETRAMLEIIIKESRVPVVIDAGIGAPSHAAAALEMGAAAVLVNTAVAVSNSPSAMAEAFKLAVQAGRSAYNLRTANRPGVAGASATSPDTLFASAEG